MMGFVQDLFAPGYKLTLAQRRRTVLMAVGLAMALLFVVLMGASWVASTEVGAEHPIWEIVNLYRFALARTVLVLALLPLAVTVAVLTYQTLENSRLGKRLLAWKAEGYEPITVQAAKTRNGGLILAVLLGACIIGILIGVLR